MQTHVQAKALPGHSIGTVMCKLCFTGAANTQRNRLNQAALLAEPQDKLCPTVAVNATEPQAVP